MFYFTLLLLEPQRDQEKFSRFSREKLSIDELKPFSNYLEEQTVKGNLVKARISIYKEETKQGSIAFNTSRDGTDVIKILLARVSQPDILRYLAENQGKQSSPTSSAKERSVDQEEQTKVPIQNESEPFIKAPETVFMETPPSRPSTPRRKSNYVWIWILSSFMVFLLLVNGFLFLKQLTLTAHVESWQTRFEKQLTLVERQPGIDTTGRFFLASYYSQAEEPTYKEGLRTFVGISVENWERPFGELSSMFLYGMTEEKKGIKVSYIVTIKEEKRTSRKLLSFYVKEKHGECVILSEPKAEEFSW